MKRIFLPGCISAIFICCNSSNEEKAGAHSWVSLRSDTLNVVKLTDTLVIYESTCRGCAYEGSTYFSLADSTDIIRLDKVITSDNNSPDVAGGNVSKTILMFCAKPGKTNFKLYKFPASNATAADSAFFTRFTVEVRN